MNGNTRGELHLKSRDARRSIDLFEENVNSRFDGLGHNVAVVYHS